MKTSKLTSLFFLVLSIALFSLNKHSYAQSWSQYVDEDGIFKVYLPENYKINKKVMRLSDQEMLINSEVVSTVDERPYRDSITRYIVKYDQTFTNIILNDYIPKLVSRDLGRYADFYKSMGGVVMEQKNDYFNDYPGGEILIAYEDPEKGLHNVRVRVLYSDVTKLEQIVIGPADSMKSHRIDQFYNSLVFNKGRTLATGEFEKDWNKMDSSFELFSMLVPKRAEPYLKEKPSVSVNDKVERVSARFNDPVYQNDLFYNVYAYRFDTLMTPANVQKVLLEQHLKKFRIDVSRLKFAQNSSGKYPSISTTMHFNPPKKFPYMNTIRLDAHFYGNFLVVQELAGSNVHVETNLAKNLRRYFKFTPLEGHLNYQKFKADRQLINQNESPSENNPSE